MTVLDWALAASAVIQGIAILKIYAILREKKLIK